MTTWQQTVARLKSETPNYFKKINAFGIWLTGCCVTARVTIATMPDKLPPFLDNILGYGIAVGTVIVIFSKLPTSDTEISKAITPKELKKEINDTEIVEK